MTVGASKGHARIVPRAATDNQAVESVVPPPRITARGERAHAVPEQQKGQPGEAGGKKLGHLTQVLQKPFGALALGPKPAQIALAANAVAVAAVVIDDAGKALRGQKLHKGQVAFFVLAHTVRKLHQSPRGLLGQCEQYGKGCAVKLRCNKQCLGLHWRSPSSLR